MEKSSFVEKSDVGAYEPDMQGHHGYGNMFDNVHNDTFLFSNSGVTSDLPFLGKTALPSEEKKLKALQFLMSQEKELPTPIEGGDITPLSNPQPELKSSNNNNNNNNIVINSSNRNNDNDKTEPVVKEETAVSVPRPQRLYAEDSVFKPNSVEVHVDPVTKAGTSLGKAAAPHGQSSRAGLPNSTTQAIFSAPRIPTVQAASSQPMGYDGYSPAERVFRTSPTSSLPAALAGNEVRSPASSQHGRTQSNEQVPDAEHHLLGHRKHATRGGHEKYNKASERGSEGERQSLQRGESSPSRRGKGGGMEARGMGTVLYAVERHSGRRSPSPSSGGLPHWQATSNTWNGFDAPKSPHSGEFYPKRGGWGAARGQPSMPLSPNTQRPQWMNAVEWMNSKRKAQGDNELFDQVLPLDQSKLGMQSRRAGRQGPLTASHLRALQGLSEGGSGGGNGGLLHAHPHATSYTSNPSSWPAANSRRVLLAQEEVVQGMEVAPGTRGGPWGRGLASQFTSRSTKDRMARAFPSLEKFSATEGLRSPAYSAACSDGDAASRELATRQREFVNRAKRFPQTQGTTPPSFSNAPQGVLIATEVVGNKLSSFQSGYQYPINANGGGTQGSSHSQRKQYAGNGGYNQGGMGGVGSGGAGGGGNGNGDGGSDKGRGGGFDKKNPPKQQGKSVTSKSNKFKRVLNDKDENHEQNFRKFDINVLHSIPWDKRQQIPTTGFGTKFFSILSSPRFWEKIDWSIRSSLLTVLPTMILSLEPATRGIVPEGFASTLPFIAFWITMPTFGSGLRELFIALKGFTCGIIVAGVIVAINPEAHWASILFMACAILISSFISEETKKTVAYAVSSIMMQYMMDSSGTSYMYCIQYYLTIIIGLAFGTAAFLIPFIRWSSGNANHYMLALGNVLSIEVQGICSSFWARTAFERDLNMMRLRQLRTTAEKCISKIEVSIRESDYEPLSGYYRAKMRARFAFCKKIHAVLCSMTQVIELIIDKPSLVDTPVCLEYGAAIDDDLAYITSSIDSMILKIVDSSRNVEPEVAIFREAHARFQESLSRVREDVFLNNENYETDQSDVFLGFFMFSVDQLCEAVGSFAEDPSPRSSFMEMLLFPVRDVRSVSKAFKTLYMALVFNQTITRRLKESIKLTLCMVVPVIFQIYAMSNNPTSAVAGASVIALIYNPTGSASFQYATGRLQGIVLGSIAAYMSVEIARGERLVLYVMVLFLSFIGGFVQAAPGYYALGNAIVSSVISVITQYTNSDAAMTRINQNCFAIVFYFVIACTLWPMRGITKIRMDLDVSLRCFRESSTRLLCNLDMPYDFSEVVADVTALLEEMSCKITSQINHIPGAMEEPSLSSAEFPEEAWRQLIQSENKLHSALSMMSLAYSIFMSSSPTSETSLSIHWVALHRIAPHAKDLSDLIFSAVDLHLMILSKSVAVPTSHFTRLRTSMIECYEAILNTYIETVQYRMYDMEESSADISSEAGSRYSGSDNPTSEDSDGRDDNLPKLSSTVANPERVSALFASGDQDINSNDQETDNARDGNKSSVNEEGLEEGTKKHKKKSYLTYKPTVEELKMMRSFVAVSSFATTQVQPNTLSGSIVGPSTNSFVTKPPECEPSRVLTASNDVKLMALTGFDDSMIDKLRKKHGITTAKDGTDDKKTASNLNDTFVQNKSFLKSEFEDTRTGPLGLLNNESFKQRPTTGSFFKKVNANLDTKENSEHREGSAGNSHLSTGEAMDKPCLHAEKGKDDDANASRRTLRMQPTALASNASSGPDTPPPPVQLPIPLVGKSENDEHAEEEGKGSGSSLKDSSAQPAEGGNKGESVANEEVPAISMTGTEAPAGEPPREFPNAIENEPYAVDAVIAKKKTEGEAERNDNDTIGVPTAGTVAGSGSHSIHIWKKSSSNNPCTERGVIEVNLATVGDSKGDVLGKFKDGYKEKYPDPGSAAPLGKALGAHTLSSDKCVYALTNRDIHSMEAFLFGIRAIVAYVNELQNALIQIQHENELARKL